MAAKLDLARLTVNGELVAQIARARRSAGRAPKSRRRRAASCKPSPKPKRALQDARRRGRRQSQTRRRSLLRLRRLHLRAWRVRGAVSAFDSETDAIAALTTAARNAQGLKPITAERRDLFRRPLLARELDAFDAVVLDPPRAGAKAQSEQLATSKVRRIVSVSCAPATFARDARILIDGGYALTRVTPIDQFLWSPHIELVAIFERS